MPAASVRVAKLGGSLLTSVELEAALRRWLARTPDVHTVLVVGGGVIVDGFRQLHQQSPFDEARMHWLCIDALSLTTRYVAERLPELGHEEQFEALQSRLASPGVSLFDVRRFLREQEPALAGTPLPHTWDVTSDSIAARLAIALEAVELVLLKSAPPPSDDLAELAQHGYIDRFLPQLANELPPLRFVNLLESCP